ncbi:bromodomain-containing protein 4-like [Cydia pomonella]|uniref:bromodomain-containing protein 4-like n=1 Tax=Cydia pomonella TaxID=82600 RepID=UPI002ADD3A10|nr:bromodomain-containing protein 4-like [Cydia pomonella]
MSSESVNIAEKQLIVEVLELYKGFPCLWDSSHELYCNKDARSQALQIILDKWKTGYPQATTEEVKKKLEHLRAAYRRERKKVESSKSTGAGLGDVYTPSLWYYPYLTFLHEKTMPVSQGIDNIQGTPDSDSEEPVTKKVKSSTKRQNELYKKQEELIQSAAELIKDSNSQDTSADAFGRSVSFQLKELPKVQRCIAEKIIGELLFYAKLGELTLDTSINFKKNIHTATQYSYYTHPYRSHIYPHHAFPSSTSPQYSQTSQSPKYSHTSSEQSQPSQSPQHSINLNKNLHTGTQSSYHTHPYRNHLYQQHSLPSSPSPQYIQQPSPSPQYSQPSPSPQYIQQPSPSPQYSQPSPAPSPQQSTPSLPQTPADSITLHSADTHLSQVLLPADTLLELTPSGETQHNEPDTRGSVIWMFLGAQENNFKNS